MTSKDYRDFAVEQMELLDGICTKPMMGEFLLYWQGKYFGGIYDNRVLVKKTKTNERFGMPEIGRASVGKECRTKCRSRWSPYH